MGNHVLEYVIKLTDRVSTVAEKVSDGVKRMADRAASAMSRFKRDMDVGPVEEKLIKTKEVLEKFENAFARLVPNGETLSRVMDDLEHDCDGFNKGLIDQRELFKDVASMMEDYGATEKQVAQGMDVLKSKLVEVKEAQDKTGAEGIGRFNALRAASALATGNIAAFGREVAKLIPAFKNMGASGTAAVAAVGGAIMGVIKLVTALSDLFKTAFNTGALPKDLREANGALTDMVNNSRRFYEEMDLAREQSEALSKRYEETARAINEATKAQNEFNRAQELALANSDEEREAINAKYNFLNANADEQTAKDIAENQRKQLEDERERLNAELERAQKDQSESLALMSSLNKKADANKTGVLGSMWSGVKRFFGGGISGNDKALAAANAATNAGNEYDKAVEKEEEVRKKLADNEHKLRMLGIKEETQEVQSAAREQKAYNDEARRVEKAQEKERKEEAKDLAREQKQAQKELHQQRKEDIADERLAVLAAVDDEKDARRRLAEANRKVDEAWGFYKDRDSLAAHDAAVDKDVAAGDQYAKDYHTLTHGRDSGKYAHLKYLADHKGDQAVEEQLSEWRRKKSISVDSEATMRVALANREQAGAADYAKQTAEATQAARDYLETISEAVTSGGEE